jgi:energy-coupling factor transporter ATP-binding protein EcfA2
MGPSGSGKTSLLTIIGGRAQRCGTLSTSCRAHEHLPAEMRTQNMSFRQRAALCCLVLPHMLSMWRNDCNMPVACCCSMMRKEGDITFNGAPPNKNMKRNMGFVLQVRGSQLQPASIVLSTSIHCITGCRATPSTTRRSTYHHGESFLCAG